MHCRPGISDLKDGGGNPVRDDLQKANLLNNFFASVFVTVPDGSVPLFDTRFHATPITQLVVSGDDVLKKHMSLNTSTLQSIFNKTFEDVLPSDWKTANISALYKNKGDKSDCTNYRPISLTSVPCKMCGKSVREVLMKHMEDNDLFSDSQYGIRNKAQLCSSIVRCFV